MKKVCDDMPRIYLEAPQDVHRIIKNNYDKRLGMYLVYFLNEHCDDAKHNVVINEIKSIYDKVNEYANVLRNCNDLEYINSYENIFNNIVLLLDSFDYSYNKVKTKRPFFKYNFRISEKNKEYITKKRTSLKFESYIGLISAIVRGRFTIELQHNYVLFYNKKIINILKLLPRRWNLFNVENKSSYNMNMVTLLVKWSEKINGSYNNG